MTARWTLPRFKGGEGGNWLENREMRMAAMVLDYPALLSDEQVSKLEETMLQSLCVGRQARRDDYERRESAGEVRAHCCATPLDSPFSLQ